MMKESDLKLEVLMNGKFLVGCNRTLDYTNICSSAIYRFLGTEVSQRKPAIHRHWGRIFIHRSTLSIFWTDIVYSGVLASVATCNPAPSDRLAVNPLPFVVCHAV